MLQGEGEVKNINSVNTSTFTLNVQAQLHSKGRVTSSP